MALRSLSARHFGARTFAALAGLSVTIIPLPSIPPAGLLSGGFDYIPEYLPVFQPPSDDDLVLIIVSAAITFLEQ